MTLIDLACTVVSKAMDLRLGVLATAVFGVILGLAVGSPESPLFAHRTREGFQLVGFSAVMLLLAMLFTFRRVNALKQIAIDLWHTENAKVGDECS